MTDLFLKDRRKADRLARSEAARRARRLMRRVRTNKLIEANIALHEHNEVRDHIGLHILTAHFERHPARTNEKAALHLEALQA